MGEFGRLAKRASLSDFWLKTIRKIALEKWLKVFDTLGQSAISNGFRYLDTLILAVTKAARMVPSMAPTCYKQ